MLIIFLSGLGNMILFHPVIKKLRESYPDVIIDLMIEQPIVQTLLHNNKYINRYWRWKDDLSSKLQMLSDIRKENYDSLITTFEASGWKLAVFSKLLGIPVTIGYKRGKWYDSLYRISIPIDGTKHEVLRHLEILKAVNISCESPKLWIEFDKEKYSYLDKYLSQDKIRICMHAGSSDGLAQKRWSLDKFISIAELLYLNYGAQIFFIGGKNEIEMAGEISAKVKFPVSIHIGKLELWETAYIINKSDLLISNDSGLMHLGTALGTPVIGIFGPTNIVKNRPWGEKTVVVSRNKPCSPCNLRGHCKNNMECLEHISVGDVMREVEKVLEFGRRHYTF